MDSTVWGCSGMFLRVLGWFRPVSPSRVMWFWDCSGLFLRELMWFWDCYITFLYKGFGVVLACYTF